MVVNSTLFQKNSKPIQVVLNILPPTSTKSNNLTSFSSALQSPMSVCDSNFPTTTTTPGNYLVPSGTWTWIIAHNCNFPRMDHFRLIAQCHGCGPTNPTKPIGCDWHNGGTASRLAVRPINPLDSVTWTMSAPRAPNYRHQQLHDRSIPSFVRRAALPNESNEGSAARFFGGKFYIDFQISQFRSIFF